MPSYSHRARVLAAFNHQEADRIPIDLMGNASMLLDSTYVRLRDHLGLTPIAPVRSGTTANYYDERILDLHDISFDLRSGEVLGIAGLLGSGRTELLRSIFGLDPVDSGEILVDGKPVPKPSPIVMKEHGAGLTPEDRKQQGLVLPFTVRENLTLASAKRYSRGGVLQPKQARALAETMVTELEIKTASLEVTARTLSGGNQQKVVIGNWLNTLPGILIMDEPTRGIDIQAKEQIFRLVRDLANSGLAVLFVSSELEEVLDVADRILIINQGRITGETPHDQIDLETLMARAMEEIGIDDSQRS